MPHHRRTSSFTSLSDALSSHSPSSLSTQSQSTTQMHTLKYTATKLQCTSNFKLRIESAKNEPRLDRLLGHIAIYDAVREWRQSQAKANIDTIMRETSRLTQPTPVLASSTLFLQTVEEEPVSQQKIEPEPLIHESLAPAFSDFQAAIELQLATMEQVKAAQRQLQQMTAEADDGDEVEEYYDLDSESNSDYDSYDGEEGDWRNEEEGSDSDDSMTDPESVRSECSSPVEDMQPEKEVQNDYFSLQPLTPMMAVDLC